MSSSHSIDLKELIARAKANLARQQSPTPAAPSVPSAPKTLIASIPSQSDMLEDIFRKEGMEANEEQLAFVRAAMKGDNIILSGAAGTGKTTTQGMMIHALQATGQLGQLRESTKYLSEGTAGAAIVSFTNKAVNNIRQKMPEDLRGNCHTIHKLLEYQPEWYEVEDPNTGEWRKTMRFIPARNRYNPLPSSLRKLIIEESSMVDISLFEKLMEACPHNPQIILLGDINQLPPFEGESILGRCLASWPVIELKKIYRQALESPIITFAHRVKNGETLDPTTIKDPADPKRIKVPSFDTVCVPGQLNIRPWQQRIDELKATITATMFFNALYDSGKYDPDNDIILIPFNKSFGSIELNKGIAQHLGKKRGAIVHEVIAGFNKHYLAIGDKIMFAKEDAYIIDIARNPEYLGKSPQAPSKHLDRWGHLREDDMSDDEKSAYLKQEIGDVDDIDKMLDALSQQDTDKVNRCSHIITVKMCFDDREVELQTAGEVNNIIGGYVLTVHKSQGSEWDRVFFVAHYSHATQLSRELLYTAVTRAKKELTVICEPNTFHVGVQRQRIPGNTLQEKLAYFKKRAKEEELKRQMMLKLEQRQSGQSSDSLNSDEE